MRVRRSIPEKPLPDKTLAVPSSVDQLPGHLAKRYNERMLATCLRTLNRKSIQEVLCQIAAPVLFLDSQLDIVFFTPALMALFDILPSDLGRPLADICCREATLPLLHEVQQRLRSRTLQRTLITLKDGRSFDCTIKQGPPLEDEPVGIVVVFTETTEVRRLSSALARIREQTLPHYVSSAERWRCIDQQLRQPAQSVALIAGQVGGVEFDPISSTRGLLEQLGETVEILLGRLSSGLNLLPTAGTVGQHDALDFSIQEVFNALAEDLLPRAVTQPIKARIVPCSLWVRSRPGCLRQMLSNLICSILSSTHGERLLLGCRRHSEWLSIELRYTGTGNREDALRLLSRPGPEAPRRDAPGNQGVHSAHELGALLDLQLHVTTQPGKGTLISISVPLSPARTHLAARAPAPKQQGLPGLNRALNRLLLIIEPDERLRELLSRALGPQGYQIATASSASTALEWIAHSAIQPDLVLTEYSLEPYMDGIQLMQKIRDQFNRTTPAIVLTVDTRRQVSQSILAADCTLLRKPVGLNMLLFTIDTALRSEPQAPIEPAINPGPQPMVYLVDADDVLRSSLRAVLEAHGYAVQDYRNHERFLDSYAGEQQACLIVDAHLPGTSGLALVDRLRADGDDLPIIMISGNSRVATVVSAMKAGVCDFLEKPFRYQDILTGLTKALAIHREIEGSKVRRKSAIEHIASLTTRQRQIMTMVLAGQPSKNIAFDLGISQRTVEKHRASIMARTEAKSIPELARIALAASERML
ncbi:response regulator [Pseudomonas sp. FEN]|uniref:response regulator n=1 Tax=Pseudomonas sp. FEN TaxID=2767468 RepID=UPI00174937E0|nr:response regulator [Pseudomonas sp. FEN]